jgi:putative two-component system response regulator
MSNGEGNEDAKDLEELEELEPLEAPEVEEEEAPSTESLLLTSTFLRDLARSYEKSAAPFAILDSSLVFIYQNPLFRLLLRDFRYPSGTGFPAIFAANLNAETMHAIRDSAFDPARGYMWRGYLNHKATDALARVTKVQLLPLWPVEGHSPHPTAYSLFLDDVTEETRRNLRGRFSSLLEASKMKDNDTGLHVERVNYYSQALARSLYRDPRWPEVDLDFIEEIGFLAAMHDVGKIGTPDDILHKAGPLNEFEWGVMKEHTINGAFILSDYPNAMAKQIALSHHEWWNGSGYPYNLDGPMIPLAARIVTIADVYDALRMKRSYKPAYPHETAVTKIVEDKGTHYDPELIGVFEKIQGSFGQIYDANADV